MNLNDSYTQFFLKSEAGQHFIGVLNRLIDDAHTSAEKNPENARDNAQRAKGVREVLSHIRAATTKPKKGVSLK